MKRHIEQHHKIFGTTFSEGASRPCRPSDMEKFGSILDLLKPIENWNKMGLERLQGTNLHDRKTWEWVYIYQALQENGMLTEGSRGLGFAVGKEPLVSMFANRNCIITATDAPSGITDDSWHKTNQQSTNLQDLFYPELVDRDVYLRNVSFETIDMKNIKHHGSYDFIWSACALEHLGSLHAGKDFIYRAMELLKPGGIAVHTTEFNLKSSFETKTMGFVSIFRTIDIIEIAEHLTWQGHIVSPLDFRLDGTEDDFIIELPPYKNPHYKINYNGYTITSYGMVIKKSAEM